MATTTNLGLSKFHPKRWRDNVEALPANLDIIDGADAIETLNMSVVGTLSTASKAFAIVGVAGTIIDVRAKVVTAPTAADLILDVNKNGTTIFTTQANRPTVTAAGTASSTTAPDVTSLAAGDLLTVDTDQVGSSVAGANLAISVTIKRNIIP